MQYPALRQQTSSAVQGSGLLRWRRKAEPGPRLPRFAAQGKGAVQGGITALLPSKPHGMQCYSPHWSLHWLAVVSHRVHTSGVKSGGAPAAEWPSEPYLVDGSGCKLSAASLHVSCANFAPLTHCPAMCVPVDRVSVVVAHATGPLRFADAEQWSAGLWWLSG